MLMTRFYKLFIKKYPDKKEVSVHDDNFMRAVYQGNILCALECADIEDRLLLLRFLREYPHKAYNLGRSFFEAVDEEEIVEKLAEHHHNIWVDWSKAIAVSEKLSKKRLERWAELWCPYDKLDKPEKDVDRGFARDTVTKLKELFGVK